MVVAGSLLGQLGRPCLLAFLGDFSSQGRRRICRNIFVFSYSSLCVHLPQPSGSPYTYSVWGSLSSCDRVSNTLLHPIGDATNRGRVMSSSFLYALAHRFGNLIAYSPLIYSSASSQRGRHGIIWFCILLILCHQNNASGL